MKQYSKQVIKWMVLFWFVVGLFGMVIITIEVIATIKGVEGYAAAITIHLPELFSYIGIPMGGGLVGYLLKSAFENKEKIKQNYIQNYDENQWRDEN